MIRSVQGPDKFFIDDENKTITCEYEGNPVEVRWSVPDMGLFVSK